MKKNAIIWLIIGLSFTPLLLIISNFIDKSPVNQHIIPAPVYQNKPV